MLTTTMPNPGGLEKKQKQKKREKWPRPCLSCAQSMKAQWRREIRARHDLRAWRLQHGDRAGILRGSRRIAKETEKGR
jgi:hypothetical protein